jgi:hypothetical protein
MRRMRPPLRKNDGSKAKLMKRDQDFSAVIIVIVAVIFSDSHFARREGKDSRVSRECSECVPGSLY